MDIKEDSMIEILDDKRKINKIRDILDEHNGIIEQVDILKGCYTGFNEDLAKSALNKIESDMNKMTLGRIKEVVEEEVC